MLLDFEVQRCTRRCATTDRALQTGETCYSTLETNGTDIVRKDFSQSAWNGPPPEAFAWWKSQVPGLTAKKVKLAPNDVLLELFDRLGDEQDQQDMRYVLALLLVRRRVLRLDVPLELSGGGAGPAAAPSTDETLMVYCPKRETSYDVTPVMPDNARIDEIQQQLSQLLNAGAD